MAMIYRTITSIPLLLIACVMSNVSSVMAEEELKYPYADIEVLKENKKAQGSDTNQNLVPMNNTNTNSEPNKKNRSIKMIVGGQSEDGLAKQLTLPVGD